MHALLYVVKHEEEEDRDERSPAKFN